MEEDTHHHTNPVYEIPRHRILTSSSRQELEVQVIKLLLEGWERKGEVALAKPATASEPPYLCQTMVKVPVREKSDEQD